MRERGDGRAAAKILDDQVHLPLGVMAELDAEKGELVIEEPGVA